MRAPFDIVHVTHSAFPADPRPRREALVAADGGRRVAVIALGDPDHTRVGRWRSLTVIQLKGSKTRGRAGPYSYLKEYTAFTLRAWALIRRHPRLCHARVVHVHTLPDFLVAAARPARHRGAAVLLDLHEIFPEFVASRFRGRLGRLAAALARLLERWSRRQADVVITVNRPIETLLRSRPARREERIVVVHNSPAPGDIGAPAEPAATPTPPLRLVYHGTLTRLYGVDLAIDAVATAGAAGLEVDLDIYGNGPDEPALREQIRRLGPTPAVRLHAPVPAPQLRALLRRAHAGVVPTRLDGMTRYSLSNKLLEYVHLGVPLLAPRLPTYLVYFPEDTAWYFEPNDARSAAGAIAALAAADPAERNRRARAAQARALHISWDREAAALRKVYAELLERAQPR